MKPMTDSVVRLFLGCLLAVTMTACVTPGPQTQSENRRVAPRPSAQNVPGAVRRTPAPIGNTAATQTAATASVASDMPKRYALVFNRLIDAGEKNYAGEILTHLLDRTLLLAPGPVRVMRETGLNRQWSPQAVQGISQGSNYIRCHYTGWDTSTSPSSTYVHREIGFWHRQRPQLTGGQGLFSILIDLGIADVSVEGCPQTWGDAIIAAFGQEYLSRIVVKKLDPSAPSIVQVDLDGRPGTPPNRRIESQGQSVQPPAVSASAPKQAATSTASNVIQRCDELAGHPDDPEGFASGVLEEQIPAQEAISACEQALQQAKNTPRLSFQLARAYLRADRQEDGVEQLVNAAKQGHGGALAYLGDLHLDGAPGIEPSAEAARKLYTLAVSSGFTPAKKQLEQFEDYTEKVAQAEKEEKNNASGKASENGIPFVPPSTPFRNPTVMDPILSGDLDKVGFNERWTKDFLSEVAIVIGHFCQAHFLEDDVANLKAAVLFSSLDLSAAGVMLQQARQWNQLREWGQNPMAYHDRFNQKIMEAEKIEEEQRDDAAHDGIVLLNRFSCKSPEVAKVSRNIRAFASNEGAPLMSGDEFFRHCNIHNNKSGSQAGGFFCACVTMKTQTASMTRAERKALSVNFPPALQAIANKQLETYRDCERR